MKRTLEPVLVLVASALLVFFLTRAEEPGPTPAPAPTPTTTQAPASSKLAFNGIHLGQSVDEIERRLGPPDFTWPQSNSQQWEPQRGNFTRVVYRTDEGGRRRVKSVEGTGVLTRGRQPLVAFGDRKQRMLDSLGPPLRIEHDSHYYYPNLMISCSELVGMITLEESSEKQP